MIVICSLEAVGLDTDYRYQIFVDTDNLKSLGWLALAKALETEQVIYDGWGLTTATVPGSVKLSKLLEEFTVELPAFIEREVYIQRGILNHTSSNPAISYCYTGVKS